MKAEVSIPQIKRALTSIDLPDVDLVVGIARGGVVPASLLAFHLERDLVVVRFRYRDDENRPMFDRPQVVPGAALPAEARRLLVVDDVSVSGSTLEAARRFFSDREIHTLVLKGKGDIVLFPEIRTCITAPWRLDREVELDG